MTNKYKIVFVQLAPGLLLFLATLLKPIRRYFLVADMHCFFIKPISIGGVIINKPFNVFLRFCDLILIHNNFIRRFLPANLRKKSIVAYDPPITSGVSKSVKPEKVFTLVFPASFAKDEPIENVIIAVRELVRRRYKLKLFITGRYERKKSLINYSNHNIIFTGFLPKNDYYQLLQKCHVILALTTVDYVWLASALEALCLEKPLILSDKPALKEIFTKGVIYTDNTVRDLMEKIASLVENIAIIEKLKQEIKEVKRQYIRKFRLILKKINLIIARVTKR